MSQSAFLNQSEDVKASYLVILGAVASADHENSEAEVAFMEQMALAAGLSDASKAEVTEALKNTASVNLPQHLAKFESNDLKFALITDLLNLAYKDGSLENSEVDAIKQVNGIVGISEEQYEALQQYVQAANKEASTSAGNAEIDANGQPKQSDSSFLDKVGLTSTFKKLGIPTDNFTTGSTVIAALSSAAYLLWQNYNATQTKTQQSTTTTQTNTTGSMMTSLVGGLLSSALGGGQTTTAQGQQNQTGGMMQMVTGFLGSQAGQATVNSVLSSFTKTTSKGNGLGNLMSIIGAATQTQGNQQNANPLASILSSFLKK